MRCCTLHLFLALFLALFLVTIAVGQADRANEPPPQSARNTAQDLTPEQKAKIEQLAKLQKHFGKDLNSPGVQLSLKEISRSRTDRTLIKYELYATGFPAESTYTLFQVPIDGSFVKTLEGVTLDKNGRALCGGNEARCQGNSADDPIDLVVFAGKGEPKRFALFSEDEDHLKGFVSVIPFPNASSDKGCRLESTIGSPNGEVTYIQATGFEPNTELTIDGGSYGERHHDRSRAQADGSYFSTLLPYVTGKKSGKTTIQVKSTNCNPKLTFEWGTYHVE